MANCPVDQGGEGLGGPCFPWVGYAAMIENLGASNYNSLQVTVTQRAWKGLDFLAGYTWAHAIDNGTSNRSSDAPQDAWNYNAMRGNGDYDMLSVQESTSTFSVGLPLRAHRTACRWTRG